MVWAGVGGAIGGRKGEAREKAAACSVRRVRHAVMITHAGSHIGKRYVGEFHVSQAVVRTHGSIVGRSVCEGCDWGVKVRACS